MEAGGPFSRGQVDAATFLEAVAALLGQDLAADVLGEGVEEVGGDLFGLAFVCGDEAVGGFEVAGGGAGGDEVGLGEGGVAVELVGGASAAGEEAGPAFCRRRWFAGWGDRAHFAWGLREEGLVSDLSG